MSEIQDLLVESSAREESGDVNGALDRARLALEMARADGDDRQTAATLVRVGDVLAYQGHYEDARQLCNEALELAPETAEAVTALITLAGCAIESAGLEEVETLYEKAAGLSRRIRYDAGLARALHELAIAVYFTRGQFDLALSTMEESARIKARLGLANWGLPFLQAFIHCITGERQKARRALDEMLPVVQPGSRVAGAYFYLWARLSLDEEEIDKAEEYLRLAFNIANATGAPDLNIWVRLENSRFHRFKGNAPTARNWADDAYRFARRANLRFLAGQALTARGRATWEAGDPGSAEADLHAAFTTLEPLGAAYESAHSRFLLAALYHAEGRPEVEDAWYDAAARLIRGGYAFILERERSLAFPLVEKYLHSRQRDLRLLSENLLTYLANVPPLPLRLAGLGYFRVWQGRRPINDQAWQRRKAGELFRFLLLQPYRTAHRDAVFEALWPGHPLSTAQDLFHQATSALRHILEPDLPVKFPSRYLRVDNERVLLELPSGSVIDFEQFETLLPGAIASRRINELQRLLSMYTGDLFPQDIYAEWATGPRERLAQLYVRGLLALARAYLDSNQPYAALQCCLDILHRDPWSEDAVLAGMRAYLALQDAPRAMRLYLDLEQTLSQDLGIVPRSDLRDLVAQIRQR